MEDHQCQYRRDNYGWSARLADWRYPTLHLLGTVAITSSLLAVVDGRTFPIGKGDFSKMDSKGKKVSNLTQPAMTSIISLALVVQRLVGGAWLTLAGWRTAFTVLEVDGASLGDIGRMIDYRCPPLRRPFSSQRKGLLPTLWAVFLLSTPSLFTSPLLTSAVNWIPAEMYRYSNEPLRIPQPGPSNSWNENNMWPNNRVYEVYNAVGLASTADLFDFNLSVPATYKRFLPWLPIMPANSIVANITIPVFHMNSFQPIRDRSEITEDFDVVENVITNLNNSNQNFSVETNLFSSGSDSGRLTIVQTKPWQASETIGIVYDVLPFKDNYTENMYKYPAATVVTERKLVIMSMQFDEPCVPQYNSKFGSYQDFYSYDSVANGKGNHLLEKGCYVFFDLNYTAGVTMCKDCRVQSNGLTPGGLVTIDDASTQILPDPLVETALAMMPDVLFYMEIANSSFAPTFNNIEGYARGMLSTAYQASWNALARSFLNDSYAETRYQRPVPGLEARLSRVRVAAWCILNILFAFSAVLLYILQRDCDFKAVVKPWLSALILDTSAVIASDKTGLCNARELKWEDRSTYLRLVCCDMKREDRTGKNAYKHAEIVREDRPSGRAYWERISRILSLFLKFRAD